MSIMRKVLYLLIVGSLNVGMGIYYRWIFELGRIENILAVAIIVLVVYPISVVFLRAATRLYLFPNKLFDPYTGLAPYDSEKFRRYCVRTFYFTFLAGWTIMIGPTRVEQIFCTLLAFFRLI
jgi:hypothetical protein